MSTVLLPLAVSHTRPIQAGLGRTRLVAAASENSAFEKEESGPGKASNHELEILSLCFQAQAGLSFLGRCSSNDLARSTYDSPPCFPCD